MKDWKYGEESFFEAGRNNAVLGSGSDYIEMPMQQILKLYLRMKKVNPSV